MTTFQKVIKYSAIALAVFLIVGIVVGIINIIGLFGDDAVNEDVTVYEVPSDIKRLEIEINAADFTIKQGEKFFVESNLKHLTVKDKNGVLTVKETKKLSSTTYKNAVLILYVPAETVFEKADITTGAGRLTVDKLSADKVNFEFGAGEVKIDNLVANSNINIEAGAGEITISNGSLRNLDLEMGVGQLNLTSALIGESDLELGIGQSNITVLGNKDDYRLDIEKGIGNITVDGESVSNFENSGNRTNRIDISGGIGEIKLSFKEK